MKISLGSWAFSFGPFADNPVPFEKTVKRLSDAGYDGIEICGFPPHITVDQYATKEARRDLVRFLKDHKLGVSGYAADFTSVNPVIEGNKQRYLDLFWRNAYMCAVVAARQHGPRDILLGGVEEFLKKLKGRIGAIHLIDSDGTLHGDETSTHRPFGEGHIDFEHLAPKLLETPNIEWWCIDMCFWAGSWELVESSLQFVKNLLSAH